LADQSHAKQSTPGLSVVQKDGASLAVSRPIFCGVVLLLFTAALVEGCLVPLVLKLFADPLVLGDSFMKTYLLLGYSLLVALTTTFNTRLRHPRAEGVFIGLLVVLFAIGFGEFASLQAQLGVPLGQESLFLRDGEIASTRLTHIHNSKVVLAFFCPFEAYQFDPGLPFLPFYPSWVSVLQGSLFVLALGTLIVALREALPSISPPRFVLYALAGFILLKSTLDGGILCHESPLAWIVFLSLGPRQMKIPKLSTVILTAYIAILAISGCLEGVLLFRLCWTATYLWVLFRFVQAVQEKYWNRVLVWCCALIFVAVGLPAGWSLASERVGSPSYATLVYALSTVEPNSQIALASTHPLVLDSEDLELVDRITFGNYDLTRATVLKPTNRLALACGMNLNLNRRAVSISSSSEFISFRARVKPVSGTPSKDIAPHEWVYLGDGWYRVHLRLQSGANWNIAVSALSQMGVKLAVLVDTQLTRQVVTPIETNTSR
jgi:hypothetical protein